MQGRRVVVTLTARDDTFVYIYARIHSFQDFFSVISIHFSLDHWKSGTCHYCSVSDASIRSSFLSLDPQLFFFFFFFAFFADTLLYLYIDLHIHLFSIFFGINFRITVPR